MKLTFNGQTVELYREYGNPYVKIYQKGRKNIYWVQIPYRDTYEVQQVVSDVIKECGRNAAFWDLLAERLKLKFSASFIISDLNGKF